MSGLLHAGGTLADAMLSRLNPAAVRSAFAPKVAGGSVATAACAAVPLGAAAFFSSIAGALGSAGQGGYAGANAWLDAYAAQQQAMVSFSERCASAIVSNPNMSGFALCALTSETASVAARRWIESSSSLHTASQSVQLLNIKVCCAGHWMCERGLGRMGRRRHGCPCRPRSHGAPGSRSNNPWRWPGRSGQAFGWLFGRWSVLAGHCLRTPLGPVCKLAEFCFSLCVQK